MPKIYAFADTVLMPEDPLRANISPKPSSERRAGDRRAQHVRFTGTYKRVVASPVMGPRHGYPVPLHRAKELITDYGVKTLIRVGSCGAVRRRETA